MQELTNDVLMARKYVLDEMFNIVDFGSDGYVKYLDFLSAI